MTYALAEPDSFSRCEFKECTLAVREPGTPLRNEAHGVEAVEDVPSRAHDTSIRGVGKGSTDAEFCLGSSAQGIELEGCIALVKDSW